MKNSAMLNMRMLFFVNMSPVKFMLSTILPMPFFPLPMIRPVQSRWMLYLRYHLVNRCQSLLFHLHWFHKEFSPIPIFLDIQFSSEIKLRFFLSYSSASLSIYTLPNIATNTFTVLNSIHPLSWSIFLIWFELEVISKSTDSLFCKFFYPQQILLFFKLKFECKKTSHWSTFNQSFIIDGPDTHLPKCLTFDDGVTHFFHTYRSNREAVILIPTMIVGATAYSRKKPCVGVEKHVFIGATAGTNSRHLTRFTWMENK